jgi:tRNA A37 methylthiotransferase MiaB
MAALRSLIEQKSLDFRSKLVGKDLSAVTLTTAEEIADRHCVSGMTANFIPIEIAGNAEPNRMLPVQVTGLTAHGLSGNDLNSFFPTERE